MLNCARIQICKLTPRKRSTTRQLLDVARSLAVPRQDSELQVLFETSYGVRRCLEPSLRCFLPRCFLSPYKFPIQKTGALEAYGRITNLWPGGSARPPDTRRASVFALQDTVRVSGGRALPPDQRFVSLQERCHLYGDLYGGEEHRGRSTVAKVLGTA